jgi:spermidine synthase
MALSLWGMVQSIFQQVDLRVAIPVFSLGLFFCCMFCHGELARMRPHAQYLTAFYLMLSLGGALGGLFVGLAAPHLFPAYFELPIAMTGCAILATIIQKDNHRQYWLWLSAASVLVGISIVDVRRETKGARIVARNFYGAVRVVDEGEGEEAVRKLYHGVINHGAQYLADDKRDRATTYYARASGVGQAIQSTRRSTQRVGIVGLGTGTIAVYGQPGDHYRFYEINPLVVRLARTEFTFLRDSKAQVDIVLGDGRISLEQEPPQQFDILAVDAFSGDSIPVHLLTSEAFGLYFRHLKSDGVLALHLSNRYLELKTVAKQLADAFHKQALLIDTDDDEDDDEIFGATWVLIGSTKANEALERQATPIFVNRRTRLWTDDYSNLFQVLK